MSQTDNTSGAQRLRALRQRRGWSWLDLARGLREAARELGVPHIADTSPSSLRRTIARWEQTTTPTMPSERFQLLLAYLYARTASGALVLGPGSDFQALLDALAELGVPAHRRDELTLLVAQAHPDQTIGLLSLLSPQLATGLVNAVAAPTRLDAALLDQMQRATEQVNLQIGTQPFVRLQLSLAPLVAACQRLSVHAPSDLPGAFWSLTARVYTLTGRLAFELHDDTVAEAMYRAAVQAAERLPDRWPRAIIHTSHTMVRLYATNDLAAARRVADAAVTDAQAGTSPRVQARAFALQAELAARAGQAQAAAAAIRLAWTRLETDRAADPAPGSFQAGHLQGFEGVCQTHVGDPNQAHEELSRATGALTASREQVQRSIVTADLALARLRMEEPEAAAQLLHDCIDLTVATGGRVPRQRIRQTRLAFKPWRGEPFVADLDEHLHTAPLAI